MSGWFFAMVAGAIGLAWMWNVRRGRRDWARLEQALDELGEGRKPTCFVFGGGRFAGMTGRLEAIAGELDRAHREGERSEAQLDTVLASMEEGVMVVDEHHVLRQTNPSFRKFFDLPADPRGQTVLRAARATELDALVSAALATGSIQAGEVLLNGSRSKRHFAVSAMPMRDDAGRPGVVAILRDVSRLRQLEEVRREFVANVSHELRTPLSIFHGYVENLLDDPKMPAAGQREIFEILRKHSLRLNALLEDLLTLARLESRNDELELAPVRLGDLLRDIVNDWSGRVSQKKLQLALEVQPEIPPLLADSRRLEQVFNNLLENASKYTEDGGRISVKAVPVDGQVEVRIEDTGIGIPPADLSHIFERFYRADKARTRSLGGTGLGLSIVKHLVQSHGGSVRAESTYGKGTAIVLRLPLASAGSAVPTAA